MITSKDISYRLRWWGTILAGLALFWGSLYLLALGVFA